MGNGISTITINPIPQQDKVTRVLIIVLIAVIVGCWGGMIWSTFETYRKVAPIPERFINHTGQVIMTKDDVIAGKSGFQKADLMDYGSLYGMGSYYGEDYTASNLVQLGERTKSQLAIREYNKPFNALNAEQQYVVTRSMQHDLKNINLLDKTVVLPDAVAMSILSLKTEIAADLQKNNPRKGWTRAYNLTLDETIKTADFLIYSSLTTIALRPGLNYTWTNNWPYEPSVGNGPTPASFMWTWISLTVLFFSIGAVVVIFRLYIENEYNHEDRSALLCQFSALTPSQTALWKYFIVVAILLLLQIGVGSILAHNYAERESFYGIVINNILPFAFLRAIHLQTPIVWIGLGWVGTALFLSPFIGGREPNGQRLLVNFLFWVTLIIVIGAFVGDYLGIMGVIQKRWFWLGNQGLSYIELGRLWQMLLFIALLFWSLLLLRAMWPTLKNLFRWNSFYSLFRMEHLLWYSSLGVAVIYAFGMIPLMEINPSFTITDFWRWWVVHLWVEWAFELFAAAITGYFLMAVGLVSRQLAERAVIFEWILILGSGILGTGHHLYWAGGPGLWVPVGGLFSFLEVLPLFLLILEALEQRRKIRDLKDFPYRLAFLYILGSTLWNFVGAGVFGGAPLNAPLVNYYEHGTFLTLNHAHTSMFGAFGLLSIGLIYLVLRYMAGNQIEWSDRFGIWAFWLYNIGVVLWVILNFFPVGWAQLAAVYEHGFAYARSLAFYDKTLLWQWLRLPGDILFTVGASLMAIDFVIKTRNLLFRQVFKTNRKIKYTA